MNEQAIEKAIEVYLGPDCYTEADVEAVRPHLIEAIAAYLGASGAGRDAEIERLTAENLKLLNSMDAIVHALEIEDYDIPPEEEIMHLRAKLEADAERLEWLERWIFERKWDGTIGRPSDWYVAGNYRHIVQRMKGETFRDAIDAARGGERG